MFPFIFQLITIFLPWRLRCICLNMLRGFNIHPHAHIGKSIILAKELTLEENAHIGSGTFCKGINRLVMRKNSNLGNFNFITGVPVYEGNIHFSHVPDRKCELVIGEETGITSRHYFDCTAGIYIGKFCQIAGHGSSFLTHSIDLKNSRQDAEKIEIGDYSFIGLKSTILKGVTISDKIAVGACSLVTTSLLISESLFAGIPAKFIKNLDSYKFFSRPKGEIQ